MTWNNITCSYRIDCNVSLIVIFLPYLSENIV